MSNPNDFYGFRSPARETPGYLVAFILMVALGVGGLYWVNYGEPAWNTPWPYLIAGICGMLLLWSPIVFVTWIALSVRDRRNARWIQADDS